MAKKKKRKEEAEKKSTFRVVTLIVISLFCVMTMQLTFLFAVLGLLPAIVAYYIGLGRRQGLFHSVFACNLSGVLVVIIPLLASGNSVAELHIYMAEPSNWLIMYASASVGWIFIYGCPYVGQFMIDAIHTKTLSRLGGNNKKLEEEWGDELRFSEPPTLTKAVKAKS